MVGELGDDSLEEMLEDPSGLKFGAVTTTKLSTCLEPNPLNLQSNIPKEIVQFKEVCENLDKLQTMKGKSYGLMDRGEKESWNGDGEVGAFYTMKRKIDRYTKYIDDAFKNNKLDANKNVVGYEGEPIIETMADLAVYAAKYVQWIANGLQPGEYEDWLNRNGIRGIL